MAFEQHKAHLNSLFTTLLNKSKTPIQFLYFHARDLSTPLAAHAFHRFDMSGVPCYIVPGQLDARGEANFFYVYTETDLRYWITPATVDVKPAMSSTSASTSKNLNYVTIKEAWKATTAMQPDAKAAYTSAAESDWSIAYHGDHIDFAVTKLAAGQTVVRTHKTVYDLDYSSMAFHRSYQECNVVFDPLQHLHRGALTDTVCARGTKRTFREAYTCVNDGVTETDDAAIDIIFQLIHVMHYGKLHESARPHKVSRGGCMRPPGPDVRTVHVGKRGGRYIINDRGTRVYLRKSQKPAVGGSPGTQDFTLITPTVYDFLSTRLFVRVRDARPDLEEIRIIYDESGSRNDMYVLYDFRETRRVFSMNMVMVLGAAYAEVKTQQGIPLEPEDRAHQEVFNAHVSVMVA